MIALHFGYCKRLTMKLIDLHHLPTLVTWCELSFLEQIGLLASILKTVRSFCFDTHTGQFRLVNRVEDCCGVLWFGLSVGLSHC